MSHAAVLQLAPDEQLPSEQSSPALKGLGQCSQQVYNLHSLHTTPQADTVWCHRQHVSCCRACQQDAVKVAYLLVKIGGFW